MLSKEQKICDWIINSGEYQEYLDDLPSIEKKITNHQIHSAFYVVVGKSGRCSYGWNWWDANSKTIEQVLQDSFNNCEKWRKKDNIDGECKPYDLSQFSSNLIYKNIKVFLKICYKLIFFCVII